MKRDEQLVVVLSRSHATGLGVVRSLGVAGYKVDMIASVREAGISDYASKSKYLNRFTEVVSPKFHAEDETDEALIEELLTYQGKHTNKPVLFPTDDYTASVMDENREVLSDIFLMPGITTDADFSMTEAMDKSFQAKIATEAEILTPKQWIISLQNMIIDIPTDMVYPCFVKPLESISGYKREMAICKNRKKLQMHLKKLRSRKPNRSVLVQEYLKISREIDLSGVCIDQQVIIPAIIRKTCVAEYDKGVTLSGMIYPFDDLGTYAEKVIEMMKKYHYVGMFDLEFNVVGDQLYFNEVNFRSGGPNYSYFKSGANLPDIFVNEIVEHTHDESAAIVNRFGLNFIYEKVAWEDYLNGKMTKETLDRRLKEADCGLLFTEEDPKPYYTYIKKIQRQQREEQKLEKKKNKKPNVTEKMLENIKNSKVMAIYLDKKEQQRIKREGYPQLKPENARLLYNKRPRVLVAGRNYCSNLTMAKSLGKAGYDVEVLRVYQTTPDKNDWNRNMKPDMYSQYIKAYYTVVTKRKDLELRNKLKELADKNNRMLLIPADDLVASVIDKYYDYLKKYYIMPNAADKQGEINRLMKKGVQKELAKAAGLPVLNSSVIRAENGRFKIPDTILYPCFIKAEVSRYAAKSRMHKCNTREELEGWMTVFSEKRAIAMVVEDYVDIVNEYSVLGVSTKDGAIGPAAFVAVKGGSKEHKGVALTGRILDTEQMQPLISQLVDFVSDLQFDGLYDIDLIETSDGTIYFVEINMRLGASGYAFTECGVNLPGMYADYMIYHKKLNKAVRVEDFGKIFVSEKVLLDEYAGGRITFEEYQQIMEEADIFFIKDEKDTKAYDVLRKNFKYATKQRNTINENVKLEDLSLEERLSAVRESSIKSVMQKSSWSEKRATAEMTKVKEKYGISFVEYNDKNLIGLSDEEIEMYQFRLQLREKAILSVVHKTNEDRDVVEEKMRKAQVATGCSYTFYDAANMWKIPEKEHNKYVKSVRRTGCTDVEYVRYNFSKLTMEIQKKVFLSETSNEIRQRYNTDESFLEILHNREKFYRYFRMLYKRPCVFTAKATKGQFVEAFTHSERIVYKSLVENAYPDIAMIRITPENAGAVYDKLQQLASGFVEPCLKQHPDIEQWAPEDMVKLRIVTVSSKEVPVTPDGNNLDIAYAAIRFGVESKQQQQFYSGEVSAVVDLETGMICTNGADSEGNRYKEHPVSGRVLKELQIPFVQEAIRMVSNMICMKKIQGYLAWDFVITENGPILVDVSDHPSTVIVSAPYAIEKKGIGEKMRGYLEIDYVE